MKATDATVYEVGNGSKFVIHVKSEQEIPQEMLNDMYKALNEWYYSPAMFFVLNLPDGIELEFQKVEASGL